MASEVCETLIELAKYQMALRGWKQRNLAQEMGLDESELSLLLNRKRPWSLKTIEAFKHATGIVVEI
jgi:antitoxin component HigA of HigAB toxin-antitoxin module